jgi:hypothetical protein
MQYTIGLHTVDVWETLLKVSGVDILHIQLTLSVEPLDVVDFSGTQWAEAIVINP